VLHAQVVQRGGQRYREVLGPQADDMVLLDERLFDESV
jgi:hypothetical protein